MNLNLNYFFSYEYICTHFFLMDIKKSSWFYHMIWFFLLFFSFTTCKIINIVYFSFVFGHYFQEGYCWTRTSGRQAARMRYKYLKAVLRQEVAYFDLQVTSTSEIITSVSNDTIVIQDVLSEKVIQKFFLFFFFLLN